ncbi:MAG: DegT/DnrJ/EryC1/StrS family aminotransferase [Candidatus Omnitrophica bacterium]|nr:DegT/DnrJ/EryC1/StrS family aminotransferase [Candidatus Omnitrophota bacterium]
MRFLREIPPTAGLPISARDLFSIFTKTNRPAATLEEDLNILFGVSNVRITYSGTAAFYIILQALKDISSRKTVIIPSFICPLVPLAIKRAGLEVEVCDINDHDFNFETSSLEKICAENKNILAVLPVHLAGIPADIKTVKKITQNKDIFIIEDCAQSLGAMYDGEITGTLGDFSFFSLCRGKGLTIYEGGAIINKQEFDPLIDKTAARVAKNDVFSEGLKLVELFGYSVFYRPLLFWLAFGLPGLFWETMRQPERAAIEYFTMDFPLHKVSKIRKQVGHTLFPRLRQEITRQRQKALRYIEGFKGMAGIELITESAGDSSNYPYLTLVFDDPLKREQALEIFKNSGLGISRIYLSAITDYAYLKTILPKTECPNARRLAEKHITLSTSQFLKDEEQDFIIERIKGI